MNKTVRLAVLLSAMVFLYGCTLALLGIGTGIGVGAYRYIDGDLERDYSLEYNSAWDATNTALANLYISVSDSVNKGVKGQIEAIRSDGKKIMIKLRDRGQNVTTINIRVGFFGSSKASERIHEEISTVARLK